MLFNMKMRVIEMHIANGDAARMGSHVSSRIVPKMRELLGDSFGDISVKTIPKPERQAQVTRFTGMTAETDFQIWERFASSRFFQYLNSAYGVEIILTDRGGNPIVQCKHHWVQIIGADPVVADGEIFLEYCCENCDTTVFKKQIMME